MLLPKQNLVRDKGWLQHVRHKMRCILTLESNPDPAHIRYGCFSMGAKPGDDLVLPLSRASHERQHSVGEVTFWLTQFNENPDFAMKCLKAYAREQYREYKESK